MTGVINGNVTVPNGASCTLGSAVYGARVNGSVTVGTGSSLLVAARQYPSIITGSVQAAGCASALLDGAVTVGGGVTITGCTGQSGYAGPGVKITGNFSCQNNTGACQATLGQVNGNVTISGNNSTTAANISLSVVTGNLQCQGNSPAPTAAWGGNWVSGGMDNQCSASVVAWPTTLPTCSSLAATLAKVPYILSTATTNDNVAYKPGTSAVVAAAGANSAYCNVQFTYGAIGNVGSGAPLQSASYGYGGTVTPTDGTTERQAIQIGVGLPLNPVDGGSGGVQGAWNGRLQHLGGSGCSGSVSSTTAATNAGYVGTSTDSGHTSAQNGSAEGGCNFGVTGTYSPANTTVPSSPSNTLDIGKTDDFIVESIHEQVEWGKIVSLIYYGQKWAYNYWNGCSTGGHQGMAMAVNYGDEFDGMLVGAPVMYWQEFRLSQSWGYLVNQGDLVLAGYPALTTTLWNDTTNVVVSVCQASNSFASSGATGYLGDPRACKASASLNICGASTAMAAPNCLTTQQAAAVDKIWAGPPNNYGKRIWYPQNKGYLGASFTSPNGDTIHAMSLDWASTTINVNTLYESDQAVAAYNPAAGISYPNEALQGATGTPFGAPASQGLLPNGIGVDDLWDTVVQNFGVPGVDLDLLNQHGGKMMLWEGTADDVPYYQSLDYYRQIAVRYGNGTANFAGLQPWIRYYPAPGVPHCALTVGNGPAPNTGSTSSPGTLFGNLVGWVENGASPDPVPTGPSVGASGGNSNANITPPLCPWPQSAYYNGSGATNLATSYHCAGNLDANNYALCQMPRTPYRQETSNLLNYAGNAILPGQCKPASHDFDGDGISDILWRDTSNNIGMWLMNGTAVSQSAALGNVTTIWSAVGQRAFNSSGDADILWRDTSGNVGMWLMNGTQIASSAVLGNVPTTWSVVGTGDLNSNGFGDILWRDTSGNLAVWFMNGTTITQVSTIGNLPLAWTVAGMDNNGNIFLRNSTTGEVGMWVMNGAQIVQTVDFGKVPLNWTIAGIGDFDGNGSTDILWRDNNNNVGIWLLNGTQIQSTTVLGSVPSNWTIAQTGDYNTTGQSGILWIDNLGNVAVWFMNGTTISSVTNYGNVGNNWSVQSVNAE